MTYLSVARYDEVVYTASCPTCHVLTQIPCKNLRTGRVHPARISWFELIATSTIEQVLK